MLGTVLIKDFIESESLVLSWITAVCLRFGSLFRARRWIVVLLVRSCLLYTGSCRSIQYIRLTSEKGNLPDLFINRNSCIFILSCLDLALNKWPAPYYNFDRLC